MAMPQPNSPPKPNANVSSSPTKSPTKSARSLPKKRTKPPTVPQSAMGPTMNVNTQNQPLTTMQTQQGGQRTNAENPPPSTPAQNLSREDAQKIVRQRYEAMSYREALKYSTDYENDALLLMSYGLNLDGRVSLMPVLLYGNFTFIEPMRRALSIAIDQLSQEDGKQSEEPGGLMAQDSSIPVGQTRSGSRAGLHQPVSRCVRLTEANWYSGGGSFGCASDTVTCSSGTTGGSTNVPVSNAGTSADDGIDRVSADPTTACCSANTTTGDSAVAPSTFGPGSATTTCCTTARTPVSPTMAQPAAGFQFPFQPQPLMRPQPPMLQQPAQQQPLVQPQPPMFQQPAQQQQQQPMGGIFGADSAQQQALLQQAQFQQPLQGFGGGPNMFNFVPRPADPAQAQMMTIFQQTQSTAANPSQTAGLKLKKLFESGATEAQKLTPALFRDLLSWAITEWNVWAATMTTNRIKAGFDTGANLAHLASVNAFGRDLLRLAFGYEPLTIIDYADGAIAYVYSNPPEQSSFTYLPATLGLHHLRPYVPTQSQPKKTGSRTNTSRRSGKFHEACFKYNDNQCDDSPARGARCKLGYYHACSRCGTTGHRRETCRMKR